MKPELLIKLWVLGGLLCLGVGVGWWVHPGAGMAAIGLLLWIDLTLADMHT